MTVEQFRNYKSESRQAGRPVRAGFDKEAIPIATNESESRRKGVQNTQPQGTGKSKKAKKKHPIWSFFWRFCVVCMCLAIMACSVGAVMLSLYVVDVTQHDAELLNLDSNGTSLAKTSFIYAQNHDTGEWEEYARLSRDNDRVWVDLDQIPADMKWAVIAVEDKDFYTEPGVNFKRTVAAAANLVLTKATGGRLTLFDTLQGASTLEQQLIKNISADDEADVMRKVREIFRAIGLANRYSKDTVLEAYLNTISLTGTLAGVEAGANEYFNKPIEELSLPECASIAAIIKSPTSYNPITNPEQHLTRRNHVLYLMHQQGHITTEEYEEAKATPLMLAEEEEKEVVATTSRNSYYTDAVINQLKEQFMEEKGYTAEQAMNMIYNGGLRIYAAVDPYLQEQMETVMLNAGDAYFPARWREVPEDEVYPGDGQPVYNEDGSRKTDEDGTPIVKVRVQASMVTMDYEGRVLAVGGGLGEKTADLVLNRAIDSPRQTGSSAKPIAAYCLALENQAIHYSTMVPDRPFYAASLEKVPNEDYFRRMGWDVNNPPAAATGVLEAWRDWPSNYDGTYDHGTATGSIDPSTVTVATGLKKSYNTTAVWVGSFVGVQNMYEFVHDTLQAESLLPSDADYSPIVLGGQTQGVTALELCAAYQIFNEGKYNTPYFYTEVTNDLGEIILDNTNNLSTSEALTPETATIMNRLLREVMVSGTAAGSTPKAGGMEAVGKTGTTTNDKDYTFVGLTPYYVTSVWCGYDTPYDMTETDPSRNDRMSTYPQKVWKAYMEMIQGDLEPKNFPFSENVVSRSYCTATGDLAGPGCPTATGYYTQDNMPAQCTGVHVAAPAAVPAA